MADRVQTATTMGKAGEWQRVGRASTARLPTLTRPARHRRAAMPLPPLPTFTTLTLARSASPGVTILELARPAKRNALTGASFRELPAALAALQADAATRAVVLRGAGASFCAGADVAALADTQALVAGGDAGRGRQRLEAHIRSWQAAFTALESLTIPVVAAVHGACVGAGLDMVAAADVRLASSDARFCVKEVDLAIAADLGALQRLPSLVGHGVAAEWALTARAVGADEARSRGLVAHVLPDKAALFAAADALAASLAAKSPLAVAGTKRVLLQGRDAGSVAAGLEFVAAWNAALLPGDDLRVALAAAAKGATPRFASRL